jgi:hypothetical protein
MHARLGLGLLSLLRERVGQTIYRHAEHIVFECPGGYSRDGSDKALDLGFLDQLAILMVARRRQPK